jgi:hypothetical protein
MATAARSILSSLGLRSAVAVSTCLLAFSFLASPTASLSAQQQAQRVVQGRVVDKSEAPLKGAVVYLKDSHTLSVKSYISGDDGAYRFGQLAQNTDYSIWAESDGKKSPVKSISSFDTKNDITITLKIDK